MELGQRVHGAEIHPEQADIDRRLLAQRTMDRSAVGRARGGQVGRRGIQPVNGPLDDIFQAQPLHVAGQALPLDLGCQRRIIDRVQGQPVANVRYDLRDAPPRETEIAADFLVPPAMNFGQLEDLQIAITGRSLLERTSMAGGGHGGGSWVKKSGN